MAPSTRSKTGAAPTKTGSTGGHPTAAAAAAAAATKKRRGGKGKKKTYTPAQQIGRVKSEKKRQAGLKALRAFKNVVVGKTAGEDSVADAVEDAMNSLRLQEHVQYVRELVHEYLVEKMREHNVTEQS